MFLERSTFEMERVSVRETRNAETLFERNDRNWGVQIRTGRRGTPKRKSEFYRVPKHPGSRSTFERTEMMNMFCDYFTGPGLVL